MMEKYKDNKLENLEGTMYFYAPETCGDDEEKFDPFSTDMWAFGVTIFALSFLTLPFKSKDKTYMGLINEILKSEVVFPSGKTIPEGLKNLIIGLLEKDPKKRLTIKQVMENEWLNESSESLTHVK